VIVSFADRVAVPAHVLVRFLENESVLLNLETERYYGLDALAFAGHGRMCAFARNRARGGSTLSTGFFKRG
jgi:hypothetical protein